ncbi:MarR family winged helix-turn-helix transcriptional regulator [Granulicoccus sp. GXG6511]|uniref:MarR family winged helix-turn-helix transcriptional regulator n=1 Tax=Granulicoccus sp. GXG6511 TaxID=3381351 RepID=UPI003D7E6D51
MPTENAPDPVRPDRDHARPDHELSEVDLLMRLARRWRHLGAEEAGNHGLAPHQQRALLALARTARRAGGGVRVSGLAHQLGIAPRSATEVADALEAVGLIARAPDPSDRRAVLLQLTPTGKEVVAEVRDRRRAAGEAAVASLSPSDRAELRRLLTTLLSESSD